MIVLRIVLFLLGAMLAFGGLSMITTAGLLSIPAAIGTFGTICVLVSIFGPNRWVELFTQGI